MKKIIALALIASSMMINACGPKDPGLKDAYKNYFKIGVAVNSRNVVDSLQVATILKEFNSITCENVMKPGEIHPAPGVWNLEEADAIADFCRKNGLKLRGHNLVWHSQFANWMFDKHDENGNTVVELDEKGDTVWMEVPVFIMGVFQPGQTQKIAKPVPAAKEEFYDSVKAHINFVVNRYKDVIYCWDVVNEAMSDSNDIEASYEESFRKSRAYMLCGDEFIKNAFIWAHEADPKATLFYNDYSAWTPAKRTYIYNMVKKLQAEGAPITGIGMQGHYNIYDNPPIEEFEKAIQMYTELVDDIQITELDIRINQEAGGQLVFNRGEGQEYTEELMKLQQDKYAQLFEVMRKYKKNISCVTFWNLGDRDSWLGVGNYPLPFDVNYQRKPVYYTIRDFE